MPCTIGPAPHANGDDINSARDAKSFQSSGSRLLKGARRARGNWHTAQKSLL